MNIDVLVKNMNADIYQRLCQAVETGKWLDGNPLTQQQKDTCLQAIMLYQSQVLGSQEHMSIGQNGEIVHKTKAQFKQEWLSEEPPTSADANIARFKSDDI